MPTVCESFDGKRRKRVVHGVPPNTVEGCIEENKMVATVNRTKLTFVMNYPNDAVQPIVARGVLRLSQ